MIAQLEALIKLENFNEAVSVIPELKDLFHDKKDIVVVLDELTQLLNDRSPQCVDKLMEVKYLVVY